MAAGQDRRRPSRVWQHSEKCRVWLRRKAFLIFPMKYRYYWWNHISQFFFFQFLCVFMSHVQVLDPVEGLAGDFYLWHLRGKKGGKSIVVLHTPLRFNDRSSYFIWTQCAGTMIDHLGPIIDHRTCLTVLKSIQPIKSLMINFSTVKQVRWSIKYRTVKCSMMIYHGTAGVLMIEYDDQSPYFQTRYSHRWHATVPLILVSST